mmetsp:Transcript_48363/g.78574  ORF Transcript_48363/g.78574 Transcript_48363/m.78574 type:complete len:389 (+) Transcript_48363:59-1225(+)
MDSVMTAEVMDVFHAYAASTEMEGRSFVKCLKDAGLLDDYFRLVDADIVFAKCKPKGARRIDFFAFMQALREVAKKRRVPPDEVFDAVACSNGPNFESSSKFELGPERFFYDRSSYTGTHKQGGPTLLGSGAAEGRVISFQGLVNRDREQELAASAERRRRGQASELSTELSTELSVSIPAMPLFPARSSSKTVSSPRPGEGPERFFYDRSTYTGTHKNGGPDASGSGVAKDGYSDLRELVNRGHVQDDALQRRRRTQAQVSSPRSPRQDVPFTFAASSSNNNDNEMPPTSPGGSPLPVLLGSFRCAPEAFASAGEKAGQKLLAQLASPRGTVPRGGTVQEKRQAPSVPSEPLTSTAWFTRVGLVTPWYAPVTTVVHSWAAPSQLRLA